MTGIILDGKLYRLRIRRLTPRECFRLQGFPDWAYDRAERVSSKSQLYKQAGNSVTVTVIEAIAREFRKIEEEEKHEKNATLNKMAEVLINLKSDDPNSRKLARYDFSKLNMTESISIEQVNKEIVMVQQDFKLYVNDYEKSTKRLEKFLKILNFDNGVDKHFDEEISL